MTHERLVGDEADPPELALPAALQTVTDDPDALPPVMPPVFSPLPPEPSSSSGSE